MTFDLNSLFEDFFQTYQLQKTSPFIVGVSGGPDSIALLRGLFEYGCKNLICVHINHNLRENAQKESVFVEKICSDLGISCKIFSENVGDRAQKEKLSIEMMARKIRYTHFENISEEYSAKGIFLGHHADDQLETILYRFVRGTKFQGFGGMQKKSNNLYRPFLSIQKEIILKICKEKRWEYCLDESNNDTSIPRNALRKKVLPELVKIHPGSEKKMLQFSAYCLEAKKFLDTKVFEYLKEDNSFIISDFFVQDEFFQREILRYIWEKNNPPESELSEGGIEEMRRFLRGNNSHGKKSFKSLVLERRGNICWIGGKKL